ncbi:hypothetical protein CICRMM096B_06045 [Citrobacter cronae]
MVLRNESVSGGLCDDYHYFDNELIFDNPVLKGSNNEASQFKFVFIIVAICREFNRFN